MTKTTPSVASDGPVVNRQRNGTAQPLHVGDHIVVRDGGPSAWRGKSGVVKIAYPSGAHVLMDESGTLVRFWNYEMEQVYE